MAFSVTITKDEATPAVRRMINSLSSPQVRNVVGRSVANRIRDHLFALDQSRPNQLGGKRTHFYAAAARSTQHRNEFDRVIVSANQLGIRQRLLGGLILPKNKRFLTVPAAPEAHGKRAREFSDLRVAVLDGRLALIQDPPKRRRKKVAQSEPKVLYWLVRKVKQEADPSVLPSEEELTETAVRSAERYLARQARRRDRER